MLLRMIRMMRWRTAAEMVVVVNSIVLNRVWSVHADAVHYVWKIAWSVNSLNSVWTVVHCWVGHWLRGWVLDWLVAWVGLRMTCWWRCTWVVALWVTLVVLASAWSLIRSTHVVLFTALWANTSKSSKPWWSFVVIIVVLILLSNRSSVLSDLVVRIQIHWIHRSIVMMNSMMLVLVGLSELVQNWSWTFCVNCWDLSHNLSTCWITTVGIFCGWTSTSFCWTYLGWTDSFIVAFVVIRSIWRHAIWLSKLWLINLLIIMNSNFLQLLLKLINSVSVTCIKPIFSELFHFSVGHLFCFLNLLRRKLNLTWIYSCCVACINICIRF